MIKQSMDSKYEAVCAQGAVVESVSRDHRVVEVARAINIHNVGGLFDVEIATDMLAQVKEDHNVEPEVVQQALSLNGRA